MSDIFSHAPTRIPAGDAAPAARVTKVLVPVGPEYAFDGFTDGIHLWWPMTTSGAFGDGSHAGFDDRQLVEEAPDGRAQLWAEVRSWTPPSSLVLDWQLGDSPLTPTTVAVTFDPIEGGTLVTLIHDGWAPGDLGREQYAKHCDWPLILAGYARFMGGEVRFD
ncbi:SRPBCC domain-containing protein [Specibacter cremeus]|uniref:SRPBCC domain-containing protein n=1 Tax=Specibacter cremeus TaxID=1629051 RepID=UPI000F76FA5A|nr:SRPBCC domain-containing protein [Specibacter cremeus]